jgi:hypothetical protein
MAKLHVSQYKAEEPLWKDYIGKIAEETISKFEIEFHYVTISDGIGFKGNRIITLMGLGRRLEIVCTTDKVKDVLAKIIEPSEVDWKIIDIIEYEETIKWGIRY